MPKALVSISDKKVDDITPVAIGAGSPAFWRRRIMVNGVAPAASGRLIRSIVAFDDGLDLLADSRSLR
jgi:hypothetical protein